MERLNQRRNLALAGAVTSAPQHPDAMLLWEGEALDDAWRFEVAALIIQKRLSTTETDAIAQAAHAATAAIAKGSKPRSQNA